MNHPAIYLRRTCRSCRGELSEILNLGDLRINCFPKSSWELEQVLRVPLILTFCKGCGLVQLDRTVPRDWMYRNYWYRSGVNETMVTELQDIVREAIEIVGDVGDRDSVLDIGANDGTLLHAYRMNSRNPVKYAAEPALNLHEGLRAHCDMLIPDYFPLDSLTPCQFTIITAIAMCYDIEDPIRFFQSIHDLLAPGGVAVVQFQDFGQQIESSAWDTICHEHLEYYTLWSLTHLFKQTALMVQRAQLTLINGGSLRLHLRRIEDHIQSEPNVAQQLLREAQQGLDTPGIREGNTEAFTTFRRKVEAVKSHVSSTIETAVEQGCIIDLVGASTKGNILLQVLGIGPSQVRQAIDRNPEKAGYLTATGIPIVSEETGRIDPADMWVVPAWQFRESILERGQWFLEKGGSILFPLPYCEVVKASPK